MSELLVDQARVQSLEMDEARGNVVHMLSKFRLEPLEGGSADVPVVFNAKVIGSLGVCFVAHGGPVRVSPDPVRPYFVAALPLVGRVRVADAREELHCDPGKSVIVDPDVKKNIVFDAGSEVLMVRIDRAELAAQLSRLLGRPLTSRLRLHPELDAMVPTVQSFWSTVRMLCQDFDGGPGLVHASLIKPVEQLLMSQLLTAVPPLGNHDLTSLHQPTKDSAVPRTIRRADQLISDRARGALTVPEVAAAVGVSVRSLQEGFRRHLGTTPSARLLEARLAGVRAELLKADPTRHGVAALANDWGFAHLGRFAQAYRRTYGELPSETLRR